MAEKKPGALHLANLERLKKSGTKASPAPKQKPEKAPENKAVNVKENKSED